jgi:hypothetical protein
LKLFSIFKEEIVEDKKDVDGNEEVVTDSSMEEMV